MYENIWGRKRFGGGKDLGEENIWGGKHLIEEKIWGRKRFWRGKDLGEERFNWMKTFGGLGGGKI